MTSIRKFVYTTALALGTLSFASTLASAQEARGRFVLTHEVTWQNTVLPAGEYEFSFQGKTPSDLLYVRKLSASGPGFMILVNDIAENNARGVDHLLLVPREGKSFVSAMDLPEAGLTLRFAVPSGNRQVALADKPANATAR